jgi:hypothetical protein
MEARPLSNTLLSSLLLKAVSWALTLGQLEPPIACRS